MITFYWFLIFEYVFGFKILNSNENLVYDIYDKIQEPEIAFYRIIWKLIEKKNPNRYFNLLYNTLSCNLCNRLIRTGTYRRFVKWCWFMLKEYFFKKSKKRIFLHIRQQFPGDLFTVFF